MEITRIPQEALTETIKIDVQASEYNGQVKKRLNETAAVAAIKGFRKGKVPRAIIEKMYGKSIKVEEVVKLVDQELNRFLQKEQISMLGNPIMLNPTGINWDSEDLTFEYEIGLAPEFTVDFSGTSNLTKYTIKLDDAFLNEHVARIRKQFGERTAVETVENDKELRVTFSNEEAGISNQTNISLDAFANAEVVAAFIGKKVGDVIAVPTKGLFDDDHKLMDFLKVSHDQVHGLDVVVDATIESINAITDATLDQEFFDRLFGADQVHDVEEMKLKIKEDAAEQYARQTESQFVNDVTKYLIENTKFDLPKAFLIKWLAQSNDRDLSLEEAAEEYKRSENGLRYQLIEGKMLSQNNIQVTFDDVKDFASAIIRQQMAQFGNANPTDEEVNGIVMRILSNQDEVRRVSEQVVAQKIRALFAEKTTPKQQEISYDDFIKVMYGEN